MPRLGFMGDASLGKSGVGTALTRGLAVRHPDGDDLHPAANVGKERAGVPLADRGCWPLPDKVAVPFRDRAPVAVGRSAPRRSYGDRMAWQTMSRALLDSRFAALEPLAADEARRVDIDHLPVEVVAHSPDDLKGERP